MKIVLLGKSGMLGGEFFELFQSKPEVELRAFDRDELDVTVRNDLEAALSEIRPDFVINCTAMANVDLCEIEREMAEAVNAAAPGNMAEICNKFGATLIHFSTDYVFDGEKKEGYEENDATNPINFYGLSKLHGEQNIQKNGSQHCIIRTSWLFGKNSTNFAQAVMEQARKGEKVKLAQDLKACPTFTADLAQGVFERFITSRPESGGIFHLTNAGAVDRVEFGTLLLNLAGLKTDIEVINFADLKRPARRPKYSILLNTRTKTLRDHREALKVYVESVKNQ